jgi:hypothetical protein
MTRTICGGRSKSFSEALSNSQLRSDRFRFNGAACEVLIDVELPGGLHGAYPKIDMSGYGNADRRRRGTAIEKDHDLHRKRGVTRTVLQDQYYPSQAGLCLNHSHNLSDRVRDVEFEFDSWTIMKEFKTL